MKSKKKVFAFGTILGAIMFVLLYGVKVLDVTYDDWLLQGGDLAQHYLGWISYRNSPWMWPVGLMDCLSYPNFTSIVFTDSIPHFALLFKLLSPLLPDVFQYFGLFGLMSFALMGGFSALIIHSFIDDGKMALLLSTVFIYSPFVLQRMYAHTSLASQWVLICAVYLWLCRPFGVKKRAAAWGLLSFIAAGTHVYFVPMIVILCGMSCLDDLIEKKQLKKDMFFRFAASITGAIAAFVLYGAFSGNSHGSGGLDFYGANLNTLINPQGFSLFVKDLPYLDGNYEGFGYIGLGMLFLGLVAFLIGVCLKENEKTWRKGQLITIFLTIVLFILLSEGTRVAFGTRVIFIYKLPELIEKIWSCFRATGRFIWVADYLIYIVSIVIVFKFIKNCERLRPMGIAVLLVFIQLIDLIPQIDSVHYAEKYRDYIEYKYNINAEPLEYLIKKGKNRIVFQTFWNFSFDEGGADIAALALKNNAKISNFYFARSDEKALKKFNDEVETELINGIVREDYIYLFSKLSMDIAKYPLFYYEWDNYVLGLKEENVELESVYGLKRINSDRVVNIPLHMYSGTALGGDDDVNNRRSITPGSCLYGPYINLIRGAYQIKVSGENMSSVAARMVCYDYSQDEFSTQVVQNTDTVSEFIVEIPENIGRFESVLFNNSQKNMYITNVEISRFQK